MAENKIKVNELQTATPQLSDTLLASGAEREYACRISDLKDAIGGGGGDWNANEGEEGYIANRTHYETISETEVTHTFTIPNDYSEDFYDETNPEDDAIIQAIYNAYVADAEDTTGELPVFISSGKININGTENDCYLYLQKISAESNWGVYFLDKEVDASLWEEINAATVFYVGENPEGKSIEYVVSYFNVGQNEIFCAVTQTTVKKIDPKYLPEGLKNIKDADDSGIIEGLIEGNEGEVNIASGKYAHAEGGFSDINPDAPSELYYLPNTASGIGSHAEGGGTTASGTVSHAEGYNTTASSYYSHAEGINSTASGNMSHAEGDNTTASGHVSHAEGGSTTASGDNSHAEGSNTTASGAASHAEGWYTIANHASQHVFGAHNIADPSTATANDNGTYIEIVGNGNHTTKSNARTLDWSGNEWLAGKMTADLGIVLKSPDGSSYTLTMNNDGTLKITKNT